jgi:IS5 family transposase
VLRLLLLKHIRNWSYEVLEREVRANLVYRAFTRIGGGKVPHHSVINKWALALGPEVIASLHRRVVAIAQHNKVVAGRKMRVDTTVVESNIHYPTDSSLLGDGVRVLTRLMRRMAAIAGEAGAKLRDRSRSVKHRILEIGRAARSKGGSSKEKLQQGYRKLLEATSRVVGQAKRFSREIAAGVKASRDVFQQAALEGLRQQLDVMVPRVQQVMQQARARLFGGNTHVAEKLVSLFEPGSEVIRKGKASKPTEFGKLVKIQEAENQIITSYEVYEKRPSLRPSSHIRRNWDACRAWSLRMRPSTRPAMKRRHATRASNASAFRTATPPAPSGSGNKTNLGSARGRNGGLAVKGASAW